MLAPALLLAGAAATLPAAGEVHRFQAEHVLGTSLELTVRGATEAEALFAYAAINAEIARLEPLLSTWREDSELSRLNRAAEMQVSADLFAVLRQCEVWRARTGGAFDSRLGAVENCRLPTAAASFDAVTHTVTRPTEVIFAPDGLAKGYVIDAALSAARRAAPCAEGMLLSIGGDMACFGSGWQAEIADPASLADNALAAATVMLNSAALAVSGPGARDRIVDGRLVSHLTDPFTGEPAAPMQVAVIAAKAADADAASTGLAVLSPDRALRLAESLPGIEALIQSPQGLLQTSGWTGNPVCQAPLPAGYVVEVSYELPKIDNARYRRPYLIIWVTDAEKNAVKHILIMGARQDWQENNYIWWRRWGRKTPDVVTRAQPTKAPGRYTIVWDGTDDSGKRVAQGAYTLHVEAVREHGGHTYQTTELALGVAGVQAAMDGKDELGPSRVRYFKR